MDGKLNCSMNAENAAFTKLRHLENRVSQVETELDNVDSQVTELDQALQDALTGLEEKVETAEVDTTTLNADTVDAVDIDATNIDTATLTATSIEAETIDVDNLENVNVLHGKTVDVERTIATIGQFTETQTTTANNGTTNTSELNVDGETNLTGQVNIDGNMTFTKDTGLSKLQGNYLEVDAAKVVIDNKNHAEYALYVPGIDGDALFGGSVAVQDTLAAKNLIVTEETFIKNLKLNEGTVLNNPILENITETQELTDKALDIDENGKIVRKFVAGGSTGTVANALIANETRYNYGLLDKYKPVDGSSNYRIILSDTANYTFNASGEANAYLENSDGLRYEFENSQTTGLVMLTFGIAHNNIFYVVVPTLDEGENIVSAELRKINLNNMQVEYSIDVSEYFDVNMEDLGTVITWLPSIYGNILSEDKPVLAIAGTNTYFDLVTGTLSTRDQDFASGTLYYLSKTNTWYELGGNASNTGIWATNNKYSSIEDTALIDEPYLEGDNYITDAPAFSFGNETFRWISNGVEKELALNDNSVLYRDENDNKVFFTPGSLYFNGTVYETNLYNYYGYVVNEYVSETPYQVEKVKIDRTQANFTDVPVTAETITINDKATIEDIETSTIDAEVVKTIDAEIDGMFFYEGEWYHKRMSTKGELLDFVKNNTEDRNFKILFDGTYMHFFDSDFPEDISSTDIVGTYQVYLKTKDIDTNLHFSGTVNLMHNAYSLLDVIEFYNFNILVTFEGLQNMSCLHLNDGFIRLENRNQLGFGEYYSHIKCDRCNNVDVRSDQLESPAQIILNKCTNVKVANVYIPSDTSPTFDVTINDSDRCYVALATENITFEQIYAGSNVVMNTKTHTLIQPTWN